MIISFYMTCLQKVSRAMRHTKIKEFKGKQKLVKTTKGHAFLSIYFENSKGCYPQVSRKTQTLSTFRVGHWRIKRADTYFPDTTFVFKNAIGIISVPSQFSNYSEERLEPRLFPTAHLQMEVQCGYHPLGLLGEI